MRTDITVDVLEFSSEEYRTVAELIVGIDKMAFKILDVVDRLALGKVYPNCVYVEQPNNELVDGLFLVSLSCVFDEDPGRIDLITEHDSKIAEYVGQRLLNVLIT